ncbi:MAG: S41 family peptidase, partial [Planctomycetota bacterium]
GLLLANDQTVQLPREVLYREFGDGAVYKFDERFDDPYSEIVWPDKVRRFRQATEGNFIGVGILIRHDEKRQIMVVNPLEGTPAYFAGIKPNDIIVEVDGESAVGWGLNDAVDRITGPKGRKVELGIKREGEEDVLQIDVVRDVIKLRTVKGWRKKGLDERGRPEWDWFIDPISRIAYVRLTQFTEDTYLDLRRAWMEITEDGRPNGVILDLRYNPGGLLTSAVDISNLFVQQGLIVTGEDKYGNPAFPDQKADPRHAELFGVPAVVIVNKGSASASEIVAGCLQAHGAAVVVGERSYGKGSVQTVHHIDAEARLKLTTHYYRLPPAEGERHGRLVHKRPGATDWGVNPDIEVKMATSQVVDSIELRQAADIIPENDDGELDPDAADRADVTELLTKGLDPQLQTALLILQARALGQAEKDEKHALR